MRMGKVLIGVRATLNAALVMGDGIGKPLGILHPSGGHSDLRDVSVNASGSGKRWQDLLLKKSSAHAMAGGRFVRDEPNHLRALDVDERRHRPPVADVGLSGAAEHDVVRQPDRDRVAIS
jgi:hypothetical protein